MLRLFLITLLASLSAPALAWGYEGHRIVAAIARAYLTPSARQRMDAILAIDTDILTAPDMLSRATWADAWRASGHRETAEWHFVDVELDRPDLRTACYGYPTSAAPASAGPAKDCVVDRVQAFEAELANPTTAPAEQLLALKYLLHFVGDMHQPLHAADNHDRGGNCVRISLGESRTVNLHAWWDTVVVERLGGDVEHVADDLHSRITPSQKRRWERGNPRSWAMETFRVGRKVAYTLGSKPGCDRDAAPIALPIGYETKGTNAAKLQLQRAGVRLALLLNRALDPA